jgi:hypothetical protein
MSEYQYYEFAAIDRPLTRVEMTELRAVSPRAVITPIRRDGRQPVIFMQCGPIRHTALKPAGAPQTLEVIPRYLAARH